MSYLDVAPCNYNENYLIYSDGSVYSNKYDKMLKRNNNGKNSPYWSYVLCSPEGKTKKFYVHRLIAEHFLANPDNLKDVHHIDNNPSNNDASNLRWMSHADNCRLKEYSPLVKIKNSPQRHPYCYRYKEHWSFRYAGGYKNIPKTSKLGKSLEEVIKFSTS